MALCGMLDQGTVIFYKDDRCINRDPAGVDTSSTVCAFNISFCSPSLEKKKACQETSFLF